MICVFIDSFNRDLDSVPSSFPVVKKMAAIVVLRSFLAVGLRQKAYSYIRSLKLGIGNNK